MELLVGVFAYAGVCGAGVRIHADKAEQNQHGGVIEIQRMSGGIRRNG